MKMVIRVFVLVMAMVFASSPLVAESQNPEVKKKFLFHVKTSLDEDDAQICVVPNVAWAAFNKGHDVTLLFDGSAVTSVKRGGIFDTTKTPMDKAKLPERERKALAEQFNYPIEKIPHNYGEYLYFLKKLGVKLFINETMMLLYNIKPDEIDGNLKPIPLSEMIDLMTDATFYAAY